MKTNENEKYDFEMERRLRDLDPNLHKRFAASVFGLQNILSNYRLLFPEYTDHSEFHSMTVLNFCNWLIRDQITKMNADEIYTLLMGCYLHDTGMGITQKDYEQFSKQIDMGDYLEKHPDVRLDVIVRTFHNEFSGLFIRKYAPFFDIPTDEHLFAIIQVSRGHRKTNLLDEKEYPIAYPLKNGNTICLPYLAALVRLADEIDVAAARNPKLLYDFEAIVDEIEVFEHKKVRAVQDLEVHEREFVMDVREDDPQVLDGIDIMCGKMQKTLDACREAVNGRTPFEITQERVLINRL